MLCNDLKGKEIRKKRGNICKHAADLLSHTAEMNTHCRVTMMQNIN